VTANIEIFNSDGSKKMEGKNKNHENKQNEIHHGERLKKLIEDTEGMTINRFAELIKDEVSSPSTIYNLFKTETISQAKLCLFCSIFNVSPSYFGKPENYFSPPKEVIRRAGENRFISHNFTKQGKEGYPEFVKKYFGVFKNYTLKAQQSLYILDYLARREGIHLNDNLGVYHSENEVYLKELEDHIEKNCTSDFKYIRICQLPLNYQSLLKKNEQKGETVGYERIISNNIIPFEESVEFVVESLFPETFKHFCNCFEHFADHFQLYVIRPPLRLFSYYIVDEKYSISEYLRIDEKGIPLPDILFIDLNDETHPDPIAEELISNHMDDFRKLLQYNPVLGEKLITKDIFYASTMRRYQKVKNSLKQAEELYNDFKHKLEKKIATTSQELQSDLPSANKEADQNAETLEKLQFRQREAWLKREELRSILRNLSVKVDIIRSQF